MRTEQTSKREPAGAGQLGADAETSTIVFRRLPRAAASTAAVIVLADLVVYFVATLLWGVPGAFRALNPLAIVVTATGGVAVATIGLAVLGRLTRRPVPIFVAAASVVTLLSLSGPVQALAGTMPGMPPATTATGVTMIVLHLLTGGIIAGLLPTQARR